MKCTGFVWVLWWVCTVAAVNSWADKHRARVSTRAPSWSWRMSDLMMKMDPAIQNTLISKRNFFFKVSILCKKHFKVAPSLMVGSLSADLRDFWSMPFFFGYLSGRFEIFWAKFRWKMANLELKQDHKIFFGQKSKFKSKTSGGHKLAVPFWEYFK